MKPINNTGQKLIPNNLLKVLGLSILLLIVAIFSTAVIIIGGPKYTVMLAGGIIGLFFFVMPPQWFLSMLIFYAFLLLGPLNSILGIETTWLPFLMGLGLFFQALIYQFSGKKKNVNQTKEKIPAYIWSLLIFTTIAIYATATGSPNRYALLVSLRGLFFCWGVYFIFITYSNFSPNFFRNLWLFFLAASFMQLPMVIYQRLFLTTVRSDAAFWDSVIGTFPGDKITGDSGGMAFFLISTVIMVISMWKHGKLSGKLSLLLSILLTSPIFFGEIKVSYVLIPVMAALVFRAELMRNPLKFFAGFSIAILLMLSIFFAGKYFNSSDGINKTFDLEKEFKAVIGFSLDPDAYDGSNNMGRLTLLNFWWEKNKNDPSRIILGHGLGSSSLNESYSTSGSEAWKYRQFHISHTAAAALLWDTGLFGLFAQIAIHIFGAMRAAKLSKVSSIPTFHQAMLFAASVILISKIMLIPYHHSSATIQIFFFLLLGMVGFWDKRLKNLK